MNNSSLDAHNESQTTRSLRRMLDGISDAAVLVSQDYRILYANSEARVRFEKARVLPDRSLQRCLSTEFPDVRWEDIHPVLDRMLAAEDPDAEVILLSREGRQTQMRVTVLEFDADCHCGELESILAITFFDPDYDAIMRRLEFVLDSTTDGIFIVNRANQIVFFNKACEKMTGWERGADVLQTYECANVLRCHNNDGESMGKEHLCPAKVFFHRDSVPKPHEMLITTVGGKERWVETNYSPIRTQTGDVEFIVGIIRDINERKHLEAQLIQSKNLALLGQLVSGIAHEIKNPLGILMSSVEIVLNEKRPEEQRREAAGYIKDEVRRLDERMKEFLVFARPKPLIKEKVGINALLGKVLGSFATVRSPAVRVMENLGDDLPLVTADPDLLHQVFLNLLLNAEQAMPDGGRITVTTENADADRNAVRIRFTDQGTGIAEKDLPRIFDPFFTTKADGTGLGLSVVHQILTAHRGRFQVRNNEGAPGVSFEIVLPVTEESDTWA